MRGLYVSSVVALTFMTFQAQAQMACHQVHLRVGQVALAELEAKITEEQKSIFDGYRAVKGRTGVEGQKVLLEILNDTAATTERTNLIAFIERVKQEGATTSAQKVEILKDILKDNVPESQLADRAEAFFRGGAEKLRYSLGYLKVSDTALLLHGGNHLAPTPNSLLGKFIQETSAATVVRSFDTAPKVEGQPAPPVGEQKLVIAVDQNSYQQFLKLVSRPEFFLHTHTLRQGTLYVSHMGKTYSWGNGDGLLSSYNRPSYVGMIIPTMLMSSSEGRRMENYFYLHSRYNRMQRPWEFRNENAERYCAMGGYNSCTHWVGNIPIGDRKVDTWSLPGAVDRYAVTGVRDPGPQRQKLNEISDQSLANNNIQPEDYARVRDVLSVPGHEQLQSVLGLEARAMEGEFANPGYVAINLTGAASAARVPVVFYLVNDRTAPIDPDFRTNISAY